MILIVKSEKGLFFISFLVVLLLFFPLLSSFFSTDESFINKGPDNNFGLNAPTPGTGLEWRRNKAEELNTQKRSEFLDYLEKFDRYAKAH